MPLPHWPRRALASLLLVHLAQAAARTTDSPGIAALANAGARTDVATENGWMPLHVAAGLNGSAAIVSAPVAAGADPNAAVDSGWTPLHFAVTREDDSSAVVAALFAAGADPNAADAEGWTPLHVAAELADSSAVVAALLAAGADPNAADAEGWTPLHFAVTREDDSSAVVAALFAAGADPNAADAEGWTPLHGAAELADSPAVVAALLAAGADPNAADAEGWTPLHIATQENSAAIVRALVDSGADVGRRTSYGWSALTTATMLGKTPMVAGKILRTHLPDGSLTEDRQWRRKGLHKAACWFEHDRAWPPKECYYFVVNEDPDDEASSLIAFPVVHFRTGSAEPHGNPVLHLGGGGPGSAMDFETDPVFILSEYEALVSGSGRDFYVIDPRGVGMSYPGLHCRDALDPVRQGLSKKLDASDDGMLWNEAYVACKTRLDSEGRNLSHYNSAAVAMDVEALRRALGVPQWVLWGSSYGARYALTIARDFPASVEAMLLNGTAFPGLQDTETRAGDMERAIERAFVRCGRIGVCDPQSLRKRFWDLVRSFDEHPLALTDLETLSYHSVERLELTGSRLLDAVFFALYDAQSFEVFPFLVRQLEHGRTGILEQHVLAPWLGLLLDETHSDPVMGAHYCAEEQPFVDFGKAARDARQANSHIRSLVEAGFEIGKEQCRIWDVEPTGSIESEPVRTSIPTLFLQGALDPATPVDHLQGQLQHFGDHEILVFEDSSHWGSVYGRCAMEAAAHLMPSQAHRGNP